MVFSVVILHYVPTIISSPRKGHTVRFDVATSTLCYTNISLGNHTVFAEDFHLFIFYFFFDFYYSMIQSIYWTHKQVCNQKFGDLMKLHRKKRTIRRPW